MKTAYKLPTSSPSARDHLGMPGGHSWEIFQRERAWSRESVEITAGILARKSEWIELPAAGDWLVVGEAAIGEHETDAVLTERSQWADHI